MFGHHNINVIMVLFIVVLSAMLQCNGIGNAIDVKVNPQVANEFETKFVEVKCVVDTDQDHKVVAISMGRIGQPPLAILTKAGVEYGHGDTDKIRAEGSIQQFFTLKIYDPWPSDSGLYICHVYMDGPSKMEEGTAHGSVIVKEMQISCKAGYTPWREDKKCIRIYDKYESLTLVTAASVCKSLDNGRLVEINSLAKQDFISNIPMQPKIFWTGATRVHDFFYPSGGLMDGKLFRWQSGEPSNYDDEQDCLEVLSTYGSAKGVLNDRACDTDRAFFCETPAKKRGGDAYCPRGQYLYKPARICITIHTNELPYSKALTYCASFNSDGRRLLELKDGDMQDFVADLPLDGLRYWIAAKRMYSFKTNDGTPLAPNIRWLDGQPNNYGQEQDCLEFRGGSEGVLNDDKCAEKRNVMCETDAVTWY